MTSLRRVIRRGQVCTLYAVVGEGGDCEAEEWLAALDDQAQTSFRARFEHLTDVGRLRSPGLWRALDDGVFEIKVSTGPGYRLYMLRDGQDWIATHGKSKPKDRKVKDEVARARRIFDEYRRRGAR